MGDIPLWFDLKRYRNHAAAEEWAYDIWVRSFFYNHGSLFREPGFDIQEHPALHHTFGVMFGMGLPACTSYYEKFLEDREFFRGYFSAQKETWRMLKDRPALEMYDIDDVFPPDELIRYPEVVNRDDFVFIVSSWCDRNLPIGINLEKTDEELIGVFKKHLKECRDEEKEFFALSKNVSEKTSKWHEIKLLAQFDLLYWRKAFDKSLTYSQLAQAIWPEKYKATMDVEQNLRKNSMAKIGEVFSVETAKSLYLKSIKEV